MLWEFELSRPVENRRFTACLRGSNFRRNFYQSGIGTVGCKLSCEKKMKRIDYIFENWMNIYENKTKLQERFLSIQVCDRDHETRYISKNNIRNVWFFFCYFTPKWQNISINIFFFFILTYCHYFFLKQ